MVAGLEVVPRGEAFLFPWEERLVFRRVGHPFFRRAEGLAFRRMVPPAFPQAGQ